MIIYPNKISNKYVTITAIAVFSSWVLHEFSHWATGTALGYKMGMSLNKTFLANGSFNSSADYQLVSSAGPAFTILQALLIFLLMKKYRNYLLYPFLLTCFYMRLFATVISFRRYNDEARISDFFGIGAFTLPVIVSVLLFLLVFKTSKDYGFSLRFNLTTLVLVILFSTIIILTDQFLHVRLL
ncbi:MAG: hypothetical protein HOP10_03795 [Chitinophagaceae bacterium]|nr:hypothetical protein [Chitinophagaceae bacterium]